MRSKSLIIYADGVFDLTHFGHFNALKQAKKIGTKLMVGVISDEEVKLAKQSYPIYSHDQRVQMIQACRWIDEIVQQAPYNVSLQFFKTLGCDLVAHGDDLALNKDGTDCYQEIRSAGLLSIFKRTFGVSTTRILASLMSEKQQLAIDQPTQINNSIWLRDHLKMNSDVSPLCEDYFDDLIKNSSVNNEIVNYLICGSFSLLHRKAFFFSDSKVAGHIAMFEDLKSLGVRLIVGLYCNVNDIVNLYIILETHRYERHRFNIDYCSSVCYSYCDGKEY